MGGVTERRTHRRYDLSLPVLIRVPSDKELESQKGKTRDISTRGLYFVVDEDPQPGSKLDLVLTLPMEMTRGTEVLRSEEHTSELQSQSNLVCRLLLEKKKKK